VAAAGWEKGRVESGVACDKTGPFNGRELPEFSFMNPTAQVWLDEIANLSILARPTVARLTMFQEERAHLQAPNWFTGGGAVQRPHFRGCPNVLPEMDTDQIEQALINLINNAVEAVGSCRVAVIRWVA
jgi:hypothetical protein